MRVTAQRADHIRRRLSKIDWDVVDTLDRINTATAGQLRRLHWPDRTQARTARRRLAQLTHLRIIARLDRRIGGVRAGSDGHVYRLDVGGRRLLGRPQGRRPHTPGHTFLDHSIAITEIYARVVESARTDPIEVSEFQAEPGCWRMWGTGILKPDAYLVTTTPEFEDHWFIEVDRATESSTTILRKAATYEKYRQTGIEQVSLDLFPRVLWVVPHERRKSQLVAALADRHPDEWRIHQVVTDDEIPAIFKP